MLFSTLKARPLWLRLIVAPTSPLPIVPTNVTVIVTEPSLSLQERDISKQTARK
jgi:hypothetical protein